jgi:hypothetical protein
MIKGRCPHVLGIAPIYSSWSCASYDETTPDDHSTADEDTDGQYIVQYIDTTNV